MATKKPVKKAVEKKPAVKKASATKPEKTLPEKRSVSAAKPEKKPVPIPPPPAKKMNEPTARTCPLVLDGEMDAYEFTPRSCLSCDEFDCRFCEAALGSGALRSRLFVSGEDSLDDEEGWGADLDDEGGEGDLDEEEKAEDEGEDLL